jgi:large subunit ribosomal protein L19
MDLMRQIELENMKSNIPEFGVGDSVEVDYLIREGDKERVQVYSGTVIAIRGNGIGRSFIVRRIVAGEGVERTFPLHSPRVQDIRIKATGRVRRAKLYYLRDRVGKAVRLSSNFNKRRGSRSIKNPAARNRGETKAESGSAQ